jgi:hypothetical protein
MDPYPALTLICFTLNIFLQNYGYHAAQSQKYLNWWMNSFVTSICIPSHMYRPSYHEQFLTESTSLIYVLFQIKNIPYLTENNRTQIRLITFGLKLSI